MEISFKDLWDGLPELSANNKRGYQKIQQLKDFSQLYSTVLY
jgi:hypothetical protein